MTRLLPLAAVPALALVAALIPRSAPAAPIEVEKAVLEAQAQRIAAIKKVRGAVVAADAEQHEQAARDLPDHPIADANARLGDALDDGSHVSDGSV